MATNWEMKKDFILLNCLVRHGICSSNSNDQINWEVIAKDISSDISSTSSLLKSQYDHIVEQYQPINDVKILYSKVKENYLNLLCQKVKTDPEKIVEIIYELIRHIHAKRIFIEDIQDLINAQRSENVSEDEEKKNREYFLKVLKRLHRSVPMASIESLNNRVQVNDQSSTIPKETIKVVSNNTEKNLPVISSPEKTNGQQLGNTRRSISSSNEQEKSSPNRPRSQSLTNKVNIGYEWFTPKLQHGQRPSSSSVQHSMEDISDNKATTSISDENLRQTEVQPTISWAPLTEEQAAERERQRLQLKYFDYENLDQVSSSDSDSIEVQAISIPEKNTDQQPVSDHSSTKRQRLT